MVSKIRITQTELLSTRSCSIHRDVRVKLHQRHKRTKRHVVSVKDVHVINLKRDKNPGSTNKYTKLGQPIIRKIIKIIATTCHM